MSAPSQLTKATVEQLRLLCMNTGLPSTGTKKMMADTITNSLFPPNSKTLSTFKRIPNDGRNFNILAIDMGIKNFSLAQIQLDERLPFNTAPVVTQWLKFDINAWSGANSDLSFDPVSYAPVVQRLVDEVLFDPKKSWPDVVLVERQRARSGGARNVIEWVFRVNMLESMLHGLLYNKTQEGLLREQPLTTDIIGVSPKRMGAYWRLEGAKKESDVKRFRIQLMDSWLRESISGTSLIPVFKLDPFKFPIDDTLIGKISKIRSKSKWINNLILAQSDFLKAIDTNDSIARYTHKGDDLADSMLHALSWVEWERNKMILAMELRDSLESTLKMSERLYESHINRMRRAVE